MCRTFDTLGNHTVDVVRQPGFPSMRELSRDVKQSFGILQTVTSAVRNDVMLTM